MDNPHGMGISGQTGGSEREGGGERAESREGRDSSCNYRSSTDNGVLFTRRRFFRPWCHTHTRKNTPPRMPPRMTLVA